ncbi:MAG: hypothetical protein KME23_21430 [Goleter apudmare HA4340-LM2]|jgi:hypothetical protein|nr:hypothetical protein [Goleter apudmare HA4340-LM2]
MADRINDIAWQAHQGSVAAIIQLLNEKLAESGVRTRAMFSDGVLQILCEASTVEELEQSTLVPKIQQILEATEPRNIRRVKVNSRIVREQQLLWLTEIERENQLLWSEEITLAQPNIVQQLLQDFTEVPTEIKKSILPKTQSLLAHQDKHKNSPKITIRAASGLFLLFVLGWLASALFSDQLKNLLQLETSATLTTETTNEIQPEAPVNKANKSYSPPSDDQFAAAVRIANQASTNGKTAASSTQWLELAAQWQRASDLMGAVPTNHSRYEEAKIRTQLYKKYSEAAQEEAQKSQS